MAGDAEPEFDQDVLDEAFRLYGVKHEVLRMKWVESEEHRTMLRIALRDGHLQKVNFSVAPARLVEE